MAQPVKWGLVSTIKASAEEVLSFCAHHLELGAHRLFVYLDDDSDDHQAVLPLLSDHPKIRPLITDATYWKKRGFKRREKHQSRQFENAKHAYRRATGQVDWLTHIDVDEFLWPECKIADSLSRLPADCYCARVRPWEALAEPSALQGERLVGMRQFKGLSVPAHQRRLETEQIYPRYGASLNGGFLSHVAGKMFYRTGIDGLKVQIHNVWIGEDMNPGEQDLSDLKLLHCHAPSWESFYAAFRFRLEKGSYRSELRPNKPREEGGVSLHELFNALYQEQGEAGLKDFYDEVCCAQPALVSRLSRHDLYFCADLDLIAKRQRYFPDF